MTFDEKDHLLEAGCCFAPCRSAAAGEVGLLLAEPLGLSLADWACLSTAVWHTWYQPGPTLELLLA